MRLAASGLALVLVLAVPCVGRAEFVAQNEDFKCLFAGKQAPGTNFFIFHRSRKKLKKALRIAERDRPNKRYPVGTILQVFPFEAMVKRGGKFNREGNGWEWFRLSVRPEGATILARGGPEVTNAAGSCQTCHEVAKDFDLVCEGHGAPGIGFTDEQVRGLQRLEPRCQPPDAP
jgi:hypothetical protein